ncbi:MAG: hypothetical protein ACXWKT_02190 [Caulobacteraceae bacterium]
MNKPALAFPEVLPRLRAPKVRDSMAELVASVVEFQQALAVAQPAEQQILHEGWASPDVMDQISAAVLARIIIARGMTPEARLRYVQHLQGRYEVAVGPQAFAKYAATVPDGVLTDPAKLQAELDTLSYRLRLAYGVIYKRDRLLRRVWWCCAGLLMASLLWVVSAVLFQDWTASSPPWLNYCLVAVLGLGGALTSIARRASRILEPGPLFEDPVFQMSALDSGASSLFVAGLTGPVFALILMLLFMSGTVDFGGLTPKFDNAQLGPHPAAQLFNFNVFHWTLTVKSGFDGAKLCIWSFIAGFAEQLVPDALDRFIKASPRTKSRASLA